MNRVVLVLSLLVVSFFCVGCSSSSSPDDGSSGLVLAEQQHAPVTTAGGATSLSFSVAPGVTAFQVVAFAGQGVLQPQSIIDSSGQNILPLSSAATAQAAANRLTPSSVNFPFVSGSVVAGQYSARYLASTGASGQDTRFVVLSKSDSDAMNGNLRVNLISIGPVANSDETRNDLEGVFNTVKTIYSRAGISLDPEWYDFAGAEEIPDPRNGDSLYATISASVRPYAVNVVFASRVKGLTSDNRYSVSGASPGPAVPSPRSAVVLDIIEVTGGDGEFETFSDDSDDRPSGHNDEPRLAAEEVARSIGRYLGLENTVDFQGTRVISSDSLSDTSSCLTEEQCRSSEDSRSNVMMSRALRKERRDGSSSTYYARDAFTDQQRAVLNNHILVD